MDELDKSLSGVIDKVAGALEHAAAEHGEKAVELALEVGRYAAIQHITTGIILAGFTYLAAKGAMKTWAMAKEKSYEMWELPAIFFVLTGIITGAFAAVHVSAVYAWVGIFRPEIYLAYRAIF